MTAVLVDDDARRRITTTGLDELLFVEAGAGTGKTKQLVDRVVALVLDRGAPMREIAAITFTEAAAFLVMNALERANGNQTLAARLLGISQPALSKRLKMLQA